MANDNQRIRRSPKNAENPFAQISREMLQDKTLSYEARGLLSYLLSKTGNWEARVSDLRIEGAGRDKVYRVISELQVKGYISERQKFQDEKGQWQWTPYDVYETPNLKPYPENPYTDEPYTENTEINKRKKDDIENTKEKEEKKTTFAPASQRGPVLSPNESDVTYPFVEQRLSSSVLAGENTPSTAPTTAGGKSRDKSAPLIARVPPKPNAAVELGIAFGVPPVGKKDFASYGAIARDLIDGTVPIEEFPEYVKQRRAESVEGNWRFTIHSLTTAGAISAYCQRRDALAEKIRQAHIEGQAWLEKNPQYRPRGQVPAEKRISAEQHAQLLNFKLVSEKDDL